MADNLGDYGNFFSGDYWNAKAKAQRDRDRAASSHKLAQEQNDANIRDWGNIGNGLGVKGFIDNIVNSSNNKPQVPKSIARPAENLPNKIGGGDVHISGFKWPAGELSSLPPKYSSPSANGGTRQGNDDIPESNYRDGGPPPSPLEILMGHLQETYQGPDASQMDFSALDKALQMRMGVLGDARNQINGNYDKSDLAVEQMHNAFKHEVETKDAARFNQIADTQEAGLRNNLATTKGNLEGARAKAVAEREATLRNLGQEVSAQAVDPSTSTFNQGIATAENRNNIDMSGAEANRATNQAYNTTVAQSIGQAGVARRAALAQQLQGLLGKVSMAESEAKSQDQVQRQQMQSGINDTAYKHWNDQQDRYQHLFDTLTNEGIQRDKMGMDTGAAPKSMGTGAMAEQLQQMGMDPQEAAQGMAAFNDVMANGDYLQGVGAVDPKTGATAPYDRTAAMVRALKARNLNPNTATAIGMLYGKLG